MRGFLLLAFIAGAFDGSNLSDYSDLMANDILDSAVVYASRAGKDTPVANTVINATEIKSVAISNSLPQILGKQPSVIAAAEGGTSVGYTNLRIRGVGGYHTNVTLNGITLNDSESEEVFWVNIPALNRIVNSIQLQRGLGTSTAGPGAFGASIAMSTALSDKPVGEAEFSGGSFGTFAGSAHAASGKLKNGFALEGAYSYLHSDGYIKDAPANVHSIYGCAGWRNENNSLRFTFLQGIQHTGITWEGVPFDIWPGDPRYNSTPGCTDNFSQVHFQLNYTHLFENGLASSTTANFTDGYGYYSYPRSIDRTDNGLYVLRSELSWAQGAVSLNGGVYLSFFDCKHSGEYEGEEWHDSRSLKKEADIWTRAEWKPLAALNIYGDLQMRVLSHKMAGNDEYMEALDYYAGHCFFNPKSGVKWTFGKGQHLYFSTAYGHREAARADILVNDRIKPEKMADLELGYGVERDNFSVEVNLYAMEYFDMLLETGLLNPSGYAIKTNIGRGWRRGAELNAKWKPVKGLSLGAGATVSDNRYANGDNSYQDILLSPSFLASADIAWQPWKGGRLSASCQYVGKQYWDNSSLPERTVPSYFTLDAGISQSIDISRHNLWLSADFKNILNRKYYAYAYAGGVYAAAPFNFSISARFSLNFRKCVTD